LIIIEANGQGRLFCSLATGICVTSAQLRMML
jgi:hypothetical protein